MLGSLLGSFYSTAWLSLIISQAGFDIIYDV